MKDIEAVDSAMNVVRVSPPTADGLSIARVIGAGSATGYVADEFDPNGLDWGDAACPCGPHVMAWFGPGERYRTAEDAMLAIRAQAPYKGEAQLAAEGRRA